MLHGAAQTLGYQFGVLAHLFGRQGNGEQRALERTDLGGLEQQLRRPRGTRDDLLYEATAHVLEVETDFSVGGGSSDVDARGASGVHRGPRNWHRVRV